MLNGNLGKLLKSAREETGIHQSEMARRVGCTPAYIWHIEHGLSTPNPKMLRKYLKAVKIEPKVMRANLTKVVRERLTQMGL
jgi:transcriptional regulator with XRE-family HTH domain